MNAYKVLISIYHTCIKNQDSINNSFLGMRKMLLLIRYQDSYMLLIFITSWFTVLVLHLILELSLS